MTRLFQLCVLLYLVSPANAATYFVRTDGNNANTGLSNDSAHAWATINKAASTLAAGDTVYVEPGTYDEQIYSFASSGTPSAWINYVADGQVICRGFAPTGISFIRIIGFEITHNSIAYNNGITMQGACSNVMILDNYIHNVNAGGVASAGSPTYVTIRGNTIYYIGMVPGVATNPAVGISTPFATAAHWVIEYNHLQRCSDFFNTYGTNLIERNNWLHDFTNSYWNTSDMVWHSDCFQNGSDGASVGTRHHIYERNFCGDLNQTNGHFVIEQDTVYAGDTNIMIRGNVAFAMGEGGMGVMGAQHFVTYNNSFFDIGRMWGTTYASVYIARNAGTAYASNNLCANTIMQLTSDWFSSPIDIEPGSTGIKECNLGFQTYTNGDSSFVSTNDPKFIDPSSASRNFRLQAGSPAIGAGTNVIWVTSLNGTGNSFTVNDSQLLCDGWGMVEGDTITVGAATTIVTNINWATQTVQTRDSVAWTNGMPVHWGKYSTEDIGALPYASTALTAATIAQSGSTYTVTPTGDARGVWFYTNGIPAQWVSLSPYSATFSSGTVTAKAYALYAQSTPVVTASGGGGSPGPGRFRAIKMQTNVMRVGP